MWTGCGTGYVVVDFNGLFPSALINYAWACPAGYTEADSRPGIGTHRNHPAVPSCLAGVLESRDVGSSLAGVPQEAPTLVEYPPGADRYCTSTRVAS